ncbi:hypothetical protein M2459_000922 [Parabacteroides sp. PF5-5]|uniref:RagB/SusD family nutrient uptake outer membrane protein n=1 Tax=unclassified Parabacteroides TaxID=2649774 RepID=UPI002475B5AB|nr:MULTISPECIES: RagB/SusD family nutrient uptake outer membrane protein [unclassified Parabacteroides]MDH6304194.1 hypothetical protein [Parabacteroides sp. PH5-39]MDH6315090.1 hypothetical protein [Parabacteroides sp. PF5-13]MDH6318751.1 hypothetical protein [Parabacteroides sp. PH5-13]MDH6322480.1 hypothetical protein [Parabacteroides sp. PH5-8]MDH6326384.1 hypothetical protein [Parabacteroides sp. PH5-41]
MKKIYKWGLYMLTASLMLTSCFDLEEEVYAEITESSFIPTDKDVSALIGSAYSPMRYMMDWYGYFDLQEEPGDCIITPTRPNGWDDGGTYRRMHQHAWTSEQGQPESTYGRCYEGINNANRVMDQIERDELPVGDLKEATLAELRAVRAFWYSILLDTHGNVPIVTAFTDEVPTQSTRQELFNFIASEILEIMPLLSSKADVSTYGRINQWAAYMILARMHLNAQVYTGTPQWEKALEYANKIIDSGIYSLSADFSDNFKMDLDHNNKECIFNVPYDRTYGGFYQFAKWYPPVSKLHFGSSYQCWGGSCANPQFINAYDQEDLRLQKTWIMGERYAYNNPNELIWTAKNYLPSLTCIKDGVNHTSIDYGYRVGKYEYDNVTAWAWGNDFTYFRYAETLMIKAECLLRLGRDEQEAASIVSQIRARVFDNPQKAKVTVDYLKGDTKIKYGTLDWDNNIDVLGDQSPVYLGGLYDEYGFEFACEAQRRTHMIRFGTFSTKNWFNHTAVTDGHTAIFPIPLETLQANANLKQNPGYN